MLKDLTVMSFMTDRIFADTNLFVYAQSNDEYKSSRATSPLNQDSCRLKYFY